MIKNNLIFDANTNTSTFIKFIFPFIILVILPAIGIGIGMNNPTLGEVLIGSLGFSIILLFHWDEVAVVSIIAIHLYVDWYLGARFVALGVALILIIIFGLSRSSQHLWTKPRFIVLWALFLIAAIFPALRGLTLSDGFTYYLNTMVGALIIFWLGAIIAKDLAAVRKLFSFLAVLGSLLAIVTLIQAATGVLVFGTSRFDQFLLKVSDFAISASTAHRAGAFFIDPNWNGTFLATMLFIPLGLFFESKQLIEKLLCLMATFLMLLGVAFTYSNGAWVGTIVGLVVFILLSGRMRNYIQIIAFIIAAATVIVVWFPNQVALQLQHASGATEVSLRVGAWQTALRVISTFPFTGVGLGLYAYLARADAFRVPAQYIPLSHPHNAYLELAAMGGIQIAVIFILLLLCSLWLSLRNWRRANTQTRSLFAGGITAIITLSVNSLSINGWTLPPLTAVGWLILGVLSSPLLAKNLDEKMA